MEQSHFQRIKITLLLVAVVMQVIVFGFMEFLVSVNSHGKKTIQVIRKETAMVLKSMSISSKEGEKNCDGNL